MKAFKWEKDLIMMFCGNTDAVVPNAKLPKVSVFLRRNLNVWIYVWTGSALNVLGRETRATI